MSSGRAGGRLRLPRRKGGPISRAVGATRPSRNTGLDPGPQRGAGVPATGDAQGQTVRARVRAGKGRMSRRHSGAILALALFAAVPASAALAQSPDETAQVIQRSVEDIAVQIRVAPTAAQEDLNRQKEQLETLRRQAPNHPMLSSLERRVEELDQEITAALQEQPEAAQESEQFLPLHVPAEVRRELRQVETLQTQADRDLMRGATESA